MADAPERHAADRPAQVIGRVLRRTGLAFPRGMLGEDAAELAAALAAPDPDPAELDRRVGAVSDGLWSELQPPIMAAVEMHLSRAEGPDREDLTRVLAWAAQHDPQNPLARALTVRAAQELGTALQHAERHLEVAESAVAAGGPAGAVAAARALGAAVIVLLDLDPEDFAAEIVEYVDRDQDSEALDALARSTGDLETRAWARDVVRALDAPAAPAASSAVRALAVDDPPADPADDAVWVPTILGLADEGLERALAREAEGT